MVGTLVLFRAIIFTQTGLGITALEISHLCSTLKDTSAVKRAFNPDFKQSEEELEVYSIKVEDILASCKKVWLAEKEAVPIVEEIKEMDVPY